MTVDRRDVAARVAEVQDRIVAAGGDPDRVRVMAVTKGFDRAAVDAAVAAGIVDLGENYAQELLAKSGGRSVGPGAVAEARPDHPIRWHFIGRLQRNKVRAVAGLVTCWQSVDRPELAAEIARRAPGAVVMIQANVAGEPQQGGVAPDAIEALVEQADGMGLDVRGLMAIGAAGGSDAARPGFALLAQWADRLGLPERSMGMSADLEAAVAEGSTMIRVGTALFGRRTRPRKSGSEPLRG